MIIPNLLICHRLFCVEVQFCFRAVDIVEFAADGANFGDLDHRHVPVVAVAVKELGLGRAFDLGAIGGANCLDEAVNADGDVDIVEQATGCYDSSIAPVRVRLPSAGAAKHAAPTPAPRPAAHTLRKALPLIDGTIILLLATSTFDPLCLDRNRFSGLELWWKPLG